jgi:hypothetical protein
MKAEVGAIFALRQHNFPACHALQIFFTTARGMGCLFLT